MKHTLLFWTFFVLNFIVYPFYSDAQNVASIEQLQDALLNAGSDCVITLENKIYTTSEPIVISGLNNITIDGQGATFVLSSTSENVFNILDCDGVTVKNIKATHVEPQGPIGCTGNVVYIQNCSSAVFDNCDLNGCGIVGIASYNCNKMQVKNCYIHKNSQYSIIYQGPNLKIKNTVFENNGHHNAIYYSYNEPNGVVYWPPDEEIIGDVKKHGLVLKKNIYK
ncbi:MAG: right-handed parallel beta-helix repeat-containing protein [Bacteroidales bacterium]|nr:right-handed parallel beta-helix repeat-containing protein [Bacteroidales bacterium]